MFLSSARFSSDIFATACNLPCQLCDDVLYLQLLKGRFVVRNTQCKLVSFLSLITEIVVRFELQLSPTVSENVISEGVIISLFLLLAACASSTQAFARLVC